jgi:hypothetical protein
MFWRVPFWLVYIKDHNLMEEDYLPILYTDNINMNCNESGVVLNVMQRKARTKQTRIVARIGMSREHAKRLVQKLGEIILMTDGKLQTEDGKKLKEGMAN